MIGVKLCYDEVEMRINGYEKYRKDDEDSWGRVLWYITNETIHFENLSYDIESCEVEQFRDIVGTFLNGEMKEYDTYQPIEPAFLIRFFPKGDLYGTYYDPKTNEPIVKPNAELIVHPVTSDNGAIDFVGASFMLDMDDIKKLYDYLVDITK